MITAYTRAISTTDLVPSLPCCSHGSFRVVAFRAVADRPAMSRAQPSRPRGHSRTTARLTRRRSNNTVFPPTLLLLDAGSSAHSDRRRSAAACVTVAVRHQPRLSHSLRATFPPLHDVGRTPISSLPSHRCFCVPVLACLVSCHRLLPACVGAAAVAVAAALVAGSRTDRRATPAHGTLANGTTISPRR